MPVADPDPPEVNVSHDTSADTDQAQPVPAVVTVTESGPPSTGGDSEAGATAYVQPAAAGVPACVTASWVLPPDHWAVMVAVRAPAPELAWTV